MAAAVTVAAVALETGAQRRFVLRVKQRRRRLITNPINQWQMPKIVERNLGRPVTVKDKKDTLKMVAVSLLR